MKHVIMINQMCEQRSFIDLLYDFFVFIDDQTELTIGKKILNKEYIIFLLKKSKVISNLLEQEDYRFYMIFCTCLHGIGH